MDTGSVALVVAVAWGAVMVVVFAHGVVTRRRRTHASARHDCEARATSRSADVAERAVRAAAQADPFVGTGVSEEVDIVLRSAAYALRRARPRRLRPADFVLAATANRAFANALERAGHDLTTARAALVVRGAARFEADDDDAPFDDDDLTTSEELAEALERAALRGADALRPATLGEVLAALALQDGPVGTWLATLAVRFASLPERLPERSACGPYLWNDPVTPMHAVVALLGAVFELDEGRAAYVMYSVHLRGFAALGPFEPAQLGDKLRAAEDHVHRHGLALRVSANPPDTRDWLHSPEHGLVPRAPARD